MHASWPKRSQLRKASSLPSSLASGGGRVLTEMLARDELAHKASQAFLSPFSPVFDLELDRKASQAQMGERCMSEAQLQVDAAARPTLFQQILQQCRCTSPMAAQLLQQLQRLRIAFAPARRGSTASPPAASAPSGGSPGSAAAAAAAGFLAPESSMDIEAMACELLASGYLVQVRDGAQQQERTKNTRSCLQNLRHRFIVCLGWRSSADAEPEYLPEPLVVEPRFREQFAIAHPTPEYEALLQAVPPCFVGSVANLEAVVKLLCEQMVAAFKIQGLPVPPWRTRQALLSKWSPTQLAELAAKIANVRRLSVDMGANGNACGVPASHAHDRLRNGDRPAAAHAPHAAVGSAPPVAGNAAASHDVQAFAAAASQAGGPQQLTEQQLMAIIPPEMQQQLQAQVLQPAGLANVCGLAAGAPLQAHMETPSVSCALPLAYRAAVPGTTNTADGACCSAASHAGVPIAAVAGPVSALPACTGMATAAPAVVAALPVAATNHGAANGAATSAACPPGMSPAAAADVLALLEAAEGLSSSAGASSTLKFTRKASAEWKNQRSNGRKMKGLLAAALKKSVGSSSRSNVGGVHNPLVGSVGAAEVSDPLAPNGLGPGSSSTRAAAAAGAAQAAATVAAAAVATAAAQGQVGDACSSDAPLIRRTHYRATGDEPWRRITTVRWGAYAAQQNAAQQGQQQQLLPSAMASR